MVLFCSLPVTCLVECIYLDEMMVGACFGYAHLELLPMFGLNARHLRVIVLILGVLTFGDYIVTRQRRSLDAGPDASQASNPSPRLTWSSGSVPETLIALHKIPGQLLLKQRGAHST